jgi:multiple sugar transport system substrate-binding protein
MKALINNSYLILMVFVLVSCTDKNTTMRFSSWQSSQAEERIIRESLDSFSIKHPEVNFEFQPIPGNYTEKIQLMLGTGKSPDLFWLKGDTSPAYMSFDALYQLDSLVKITPEFDVDDFFPVFKDAFKYKGHYYGFGKDFNVYVLFYNPEMFKEAGLEHPPKNWEELVSYSKKLTIDKDGDGKIDQFGFVVEPSIDMLMPFAYQNGAELISESNKIVINSPEFKEAFNYFVGMYRNNIATIPSDQGASWNGDIYGRKKAAMVVSGAWIIPYLKENFPNVPYKVAELPMGKQKATLAFCNAYVMPKDTKHLKDAWEMFSFLAGKEGMRQWTASGIAFPTRKSVAIENGLYQDSISKVFIKSLEYAKLYKINLKERWFDDCQAAMQAVFYENKNPNDVLDKLAKKLEKYKLNK